MIDSKPCSAGLQTCNIFFGDSCATIILYTAEISSLLPTCEAAGHLFADGVGPTGILAFPVFWLLEFSLLLIVSTLEHRQIDLTSMLLKLNLSGLVTLSSFRSLI